MNWQSQEEFLAKCAVRIQAVGKSGYGTGFFVARDLILTCAHVIRKNDQILKQVKFYWQEEEYQAEVDQFPEDNKKIDIALLKVTNPNLVFGRKKEIKEIFDILKCGGGVALIGDKGSGKSSLLASTSSSVTANYSRFNFNYCNSIFIE